MLDNLLPYLETAPIAVAFIIYVVVSDRLKSKMMEGYKNIVDGYKAIIEKDKQTTDKLIDLVEELTRKK
jgi:hypothetical protein